MRDIVVAAIATCAIVGGLTVYLRAQDCPKTSPLTDAQIDAIFQHTERGPGMDYTLRNFAREIEKAHGITTP